MAISYTGRIVSTLLILGGMGVWFYDTTEKTYAKERLARHEALPLSLKPYDTNKDGRLEWTELEHLSYDFREFKQKAQSSSQKPLENR